MVTCDLCNKQTAGKLYPILYRNRGKHMICQSCMDNYELFRDREYERQREEGIVYGHTVKPEETR